MRTQRILAMVAALAALFALTPVAASAQTRGPNRNAAPLHGAAPRAAAPRVPPPSAEQVLTDARAALTAAGSPCQATNARFGGTGTLPKTDGTRGTDVVTLYEVVCSTGPGYLVVKRPTTVAVTNCFLASTAAAQARAAGQPVGQTCQLPENADVKRTLAPLAQAAHIGCDYDAAVLVGRSTDADRYEFGCPGADGYWVETNVDGFDLKRVLPCLEVRGAGGACSLTTPEEQTATLSAWVQQGGKTCTVANSRYVGGDANRRYYEVGCAGAPGFMIRTSANNEYQAVVPCDQATAIAGGCTLTDAAVVAQVGNQTYAAMLQAANIPCAYQNHRVIGAIDGGARRVVEYTCSDKPLGLVAFLPEAGRAGVRVESFDCIGAEGRSAQLACTLTSRATIMARLTQAMTAGGKPCDVTNYRVIGLTGDGDGDVLELKCGAGGGFIAEVPAARARIGTALTCDVSAQRGGDRCEL